MVAFLMQLLESSFGEQARISQRDDNIHVTIVSQKLAGGINRLTSGWAVYVGFWTYDQSLVDEVALELTPAWEAGCGDCLRRVGQWRTIVAWCAAGSHATTD